MLQARTPQVDQAGGPVVTVRVVLAHDNPKVSRMVPVVPFSVGTVFSMSAPAERWRQSHKATDKTAAAVQQQVAAMGSELFEVGLYNPDAGASESIMIP